VAVIRVYTFNEKGWLLTEPPKLFQNYTNRMAASTQSKENTQNWALQSRKREAPIGIFKFYLAIVPRYEEVLQLTLLHLCP
jgi:hypothetical protein